MRVQSNIDDALTDDILKGNSSSVAVQNSIRWGVKQQRKAVERLSAAFLRSRRSIFQDLFL